MNMKVFINAVITGIIWWFTYLYIRRYLNPENKGDVKKYKMDAVYGGIASFCAVLINYYINMLLPA